MDTSHIFLALALIEDGRIIGRVQEKCWKRQSEEIFPKLMEMTEKAGIRPEDIGQVVITEGPGSYTGVRIAMTVAKVFCAMGNKPLGVIGTLQLYAGTGENVRVLLDARGKRAYTALFSRGVMQGEAAALDLAEISRMLGNETVAGDGHLIGREDIYPDLAENFLALKDQWRFADNVHLVVPEYLKSSESYLVKK